MKTRYLKPGFFKNEELFALPATARILYQGLWLMADTEGRLRDRPGEIQGEVFPYGRGSVEPLLKKLTEGGFIKRYEVGRQKLIWVPTFLDHQKPHAHEPASTLPRHPDDQSTDNVPPTSRQKPDNVGPSPTLKPELESKSDAEPEQEPESLPRRNIFVLYEKSFGHSFSPLERERMEEMEGEYEADCVEHAFREAAELNKRSLRYVDKICQRHKEQGGCFDGRPGPNGASAQEANRSTADRAAIERLGIGKREVILD